MIKQFWLVFVVTPALLFHISGVLAQKKEPETTDTASNCSSFAREVLCKGNILDSTKRPNQTIRFKYRSLSSDCPLYCQVCDRLYTAKDHDSWEGQFRYCAPDLATAPNIWQPGDSHRMYKRIAEQFRDRYKSLVLSSPSLNGGPWIIQLDDFLTEEECQAMILETEKAIVSSPGHFAVMAEDLADENGGECVSTQVWCSNECMQKKALQSVKSKVEELVDMPWEQAEELHMIKYVPGQRYGNHHDFIYEEVESLHGPRLFTLLFYLNNPATGGETCFPDLNHPFCVHPKIGRAVIFPQVLNKDPEAKDNRTWHEAEGVVGGIKYSSTVWYHLRSYQRSREVGCAYIDDLDDEEMYESIYNDALDDNPITTIMEMLQNS